MSERSPIEPFDAAPPRSGCLTALLVVMILANVVTGLLYLLLFARGQTIGNASLWAIGVLVLFSIVNVVSLISIWRWRKWGFFGFVFSVVVVFALNVSIGLPPAAAVVGLISPIVLFLLLRPVWKSLE